MSRVVSGLDHEGDDVRLASHCTYYVVTAARCEDACDRPRCCALVVGHAGVRDSGVGGGWERNSEQASTAEVDIASVTHHADGRVVVGLRAQPAAALDTGSVAVNVDGVSGPVRVTSLGGEAAKAIAIVVDTSGSINGEPMLAARRAVGDLIRLLPPQDEGHCLPLPTRRTWWCPSRRIARHCCRRPMG